MGHARKGWEGPLPPLWVAVGDHGRVTALPEMSWRQVPEEPHLMPLGVEGLGCSESREQIPGVGGSLEHGRESPGKLLECLQRMNRQLRRLRGP